MKIEAGKSYRTRDGHKATIYRTDARCEYPVHGAVAFADHDSHQIWTLEGKWGKYGGDRMDLIAPWTDEPTMDISALPKWATHVQRFSFGWAWETGALSALIPPEYAPKETSPDGSRYRIDRENNRLVLEEGGAK